MSDKIHKQSFSINNAPTRSVTIYPTRAAVVRVVENVYIQVSSPPSSSSSPSFKHY